MAWLRPECGNRWTSRALGSIAGLSVGLALVPSAQAQSEERRFERAIRQAAAYGERFRVDTSLGVTERSVLDVGGFASFFALHLTDSDDNARRLLQPEVSLYARLAIDGAHTLFARARFQYRDFSSGDSFDERGDSWAEPIMDRFWYEFDLAGAMAAYEGRVIDGTFNLRVGRQFVDWGAGLSLSETLYAARPTIVTGPFSIEGLVGVTPTDRSITDFDASRDDFNSDTERAFFGGLFRYDTRTGHQIYTYILAQQDNNDGTEPRAAIPPPVDFDYNSTYLGIGAQGAITQKLFYDAEFVYEFGDSRSDPLRGPQVKEDISAFAGRFLLGYLFGDVRQSQVQFEALFATGDDDRLVTTDTVGGNLAGTTDTAFNSLGFVNTGLAFAPALSNLLAFRLGVVSNPFADIESVRQLQVGVDLFLLNKFDSDAPIEEPTDNSMFLGIETDLSINYRITSDLALTARYGVFFPGDAIESQSVRHFVFGGVTLSF